MALGGATVLLVLFVAASLRLAYGSNYPDHGDLLWELAVIMCVAFLFGFPRPIRFIAAHVAALPYPADEPQPSGDRQTKREILLVSALGVIAASDVALVVQLVLQTGGASRSPFVCFLFTVFVVASSFAGRYVWKQFALLVLSCSLFAVIDLTHWFGTFSPPVGHPRLSLLLLSAVCANLTIAFYLTYLSQSSLADLQEKDPSERGRASG
jgi:hypothetical protein